LGNCTTTPLRGALFETWVVAELLKAAYNRGELPGLSFYRTRDGLEVDLIAETPQGLHACEFLVQCDIGPAVGGSETHKGLLIWTQFAQVMRSAIRLARRSSSARGSTRPQTCLLPASTPITTRPPEVLANATTVLRTFSGQISLKLHGLAFILAE
jgi:hypothetical protein